MTDLPEEPRKVNGQLDRGCWGAGDLVGRCRVGRARAPFNKCTTLPLLHPVRLYYGTVSISCHYFLYPHEPLRTSNRQEEGAPSARPIAAAHLLNQRRCDRTCNRDRSARLFRF